MDEGGPAQRQSLAAYGSVDPDQSLVVIFYHCHGYYRWTVGSHRTRTCTMVAYDVMWVGLVSSAF